MGSESASASWPTWRRDPSSPRALERSARVAGEVQRAAARRREGAQRGPAGAHGAQLGAGAGLRAALARAGGRSTVLGDLARGRRFEFDLGRVAFALALQRLSASRAATCKVRRGSRRSSAPGFDGIELQHIYRTVGGSRRCATIWSRSCSSRIETSSRKPGPRLHRHDQHLHLPLRGDRVCAGVATRATACRTVPRCDLLGRGPPGVAIAWDMLPGQHRGHRLVRRDDARSCVNASASVASPSSPTGA